MWNVLSICNELFLKSRGKWAHRFIWFSTVVSSVFCWRLFLLSMAQSATSNLLTVPKIVSRISVVTLLLLSGIYSWAEWGIPNVLSLLIDVLYMSVRQLLSLLFTVELHTSLSFIGPWAHLQWNSTLCMDLKAIVLCLSDKAK